MYEGKVMNAVGCEAKRTSQTEDELRSLERAVSAALERFAAFEARLGSVLRPMMPGKEAAGCAEQTLVPLADDIRQQRYRIESLLRQIELVLDRVET